MTDYRNRIKALEYVNAAEVSPGETPGLQPGEGGSRPTRPLEFRSSYDALSILPCCQRFLVKEKTIPYLAVGNQGLAAVDVVFQRGGLKTQEGRRGGNVVYGHNSLGCNAVLTDVGASSTSYPRPRKSSATWLRWQV